MSETKQAQSQVSCIGRPQPKTWDDFEQGCMGTFRGGHHDDGELKAFQHGMATIFNLLRGEFPPAEQCKMAANLTRAVEAAGRLADVIDVLWGQNHQVAGWHQNGDLEPFDNFVDSNTEPGDVTAIREALAELSAIVKAEGTP